MKAVTAALLLLMGVGAQRPPCPPPASILPCVCATRNQELQVWCTHSDMPRVMEGIKAIGEYVSRPIDEVIIEHNYLPSLPGRAFRPLKALRLMLRHNSLERVAPGWLSGLEDSLMELFIVEDDLRSLPVDSVAHMKKLQAITIESDQLKRLPSFSRLNNLRYLKVQSSSLIELNSRSFKHLPALEKLHVNGSPRLNRLESNLLHDLPRLSMVNISDCGLSWIHLRAMSLLPSLAEISLENNKLTDAGMVGRACRELPALNTLRLDGNKIDRLNEASFVDLPALKELSISRNIITEIFHGAFHKVPSLKILDLNYNIVQRIHPESFLQASGSGLEELWLVGNEVGHVSELRAILDALPRLKFLDMSRNVLENIPYGALRGHPTLERLHLDNNRIRMIEREAFMAMPALRELRLKNNSLSNHIDGPFWNLPALKGLDLSFNYFRRLEPRLITNLPSLRKVDLSKNNIAIIDPMTFVDTPLLEHVNLSGNSLASIHPATFRHLMGLYELDVSRNRLLEFVPGLPRGIEYIHISNNQISSLPLPPSPDLDLPSLRMLDMSANSIRNIPSGVMASLPQLRKLDISLNGLQHIEEGSFTGLARLEMLHLHNNMLMSINPNVFKDMIGLTRLDINGNILEILKSDILRDTPHLRKLDISKNRLRDISVNALENSKSLEILNISSNYLTSLPETLSGLTKLSLLDISNNQLKAINPSVLSTLSSLKELRMSKNKLLELKEGAFQDLQSLEILDLRGNELEMMHSGSIRMLPDVETILLNENHLIEIPDATFAELPSLRSVELQNNHLRKVSNNAFYKVPQLQFLNMSFNKISGLESAGLKNLKSLEVLDLSDNSVSRVGSMGFENMEWLVELKMDNNKICAVQGSPFNGMPRLKVLSLRNNKMTSLPETSVKSLRSNIAVLDIDGNPLACGCSLAWFRAWLQEASLLGPRCSDGSLLKERKLYRIECESEKFREEPVLPGCESEIVQDVPLYGTSQVFSPWMEKIRDQSHPIPQIANNVHMAPSPEESEYFYDEYVDYPYNETNLVEMTNTSNKYISVNRTHHSNSTPSYHYIPGDTPTLYAGQNLNKTINANQNGNAKPSIGTGFTFFGMPLPAINIGKLWGNERKVNEGRSQDANVRAYNITQPNVQAGGFVPLTPGAAGGFTPISDPSENSTPAFYGREKLLPNNTQWPNDFPSSGSVNVDKKLVPPLGIIGSDKGALFDSIPQIQSNRSNYLLSPTVSDLPQSTNDNFVHINSNLPDITKGANDVSFKSNQNLSYSSSNSIHTRDPIYNSVLSHNNSQSSSKESALEIQRLIENAPLNSKGFSNDPSLLENKREKIESTPNNFDQLLNKDQDGNNARQSTSPSALSVLAVPGAQYSQPMGRKSATITKVEYPNNLNDDGVIPPPSEPFKSNNRGAKTSFFSEYDTSVKGGMHNSSLSWYYKNYNQSGLDPFVGPGVEMFGSGQNVIKCDILVLSLILCASLFPNIILMAA